jgi:hypothetical protein
MSCGYSTIEARALRQLSSFSSLGWYSVLLVLEVTALTLDMQIGACDFDYYAVYALRSEQWLSLETPKDKLNLTLAIETPRVRLDEAYKFCDLLHRGDHTVVEALFVEEPIFESSSWKELRKSRQALSRTKAVISKARDFI